MGGPRRGHPAIETLATPPSTTLGLRRLLAPDAAHPRVIRIVAVVFVLAVAAVSYVASSAFLNPTDATVYLAAGERLNAGHELYSLQPGDRPIALNPPYWTVPTLSPPMLGIAWQPLALLGTAGIWVGWGLTALIFMASLAILVYSTPLWGSLAVAALAPKIGDQLAIGNVNGLLAAGVLCIWVLRDRAWLVGGLLSVMVLIKVTPVVLVVWLVATRRYRALLAAAVCTLVLGSLALVLVGLDTHLEYLDIATYTVSDGTSSASVSGTARRLGFPPAIAQAAPWLLLITGTLLIIAWHKHPARGLAIAVVLMTVASPAFNPYWLALTMFALVPFALPARSEVAP
jgi:alpha-1,2-mannosyltransferase